MKLAKWTDPERRAFFMVLFVALVLRGAFIFHPGHQMDIGLFERWAEKGATVGVVNIYDRDKSDIIPDYPPLLLFVYTAVGKSVLLLQGDFTHSPVFVAALKVPAIAADFLIALLLVAVGTRIRTRYDGILAAALYLLLPASWLDSAVWGQMDPIYTALLLLAFAAVGSKRFIVAGAAAGLAISAKFQVIAFLPMLAVVVAAMDWRGLLKGLTSFAVTVAIVFMPFVLAGKHRSVLYAYTHAVGAYDVLSVDAFNIWELLFGRSARTTSDLIVAGGLSYRTWGLLAFIAASGVSLIVVWRRASLSPPHPLMLEFSLRAAAVASLVFFMLPTEIHDRYLFPFLALAAGWALRGTTELMLYLILSISIAFNIAFPLPISVSDTFFSLMPFADRLLALSILVAGSAAIPMLLRGTQKHTT